MDLVGLSYVPSFPSPPERADPFLDVLQAQIKTLATAAVPAYERNAQRNEDAFMGELMFSLPFLHTPSSGCLPEGETVMFPRPIPRPGVVAGEGEGAEHNDVEEGNSKNEKQKDDTNYSLPPPNPDPCTGLFRLDLGRRLGDYHHAQGQGLVTGNMGDIVGLHGLKNDEVGRFSISPHPLFHLPRFIKNKRNNAEAKI